MRKSRKRVSRKRVSRKRVSRKHTSKKLKYSAGRRGGKGGYSGGGRWSRLGGGSGRVRDMLRQSGHSERLTTRSRGRQGGHSGRLTTRGREHTDWRRPYGPVEYRQMSSPPDFTQYEMAHLTLPEVLQKSESRDIIFQKEIRDNITTTNDRTRKAIEEAIKLGITKNLTVTETILYLTPLAYPDYSGGYKIINIKPSAPQMVILNVWVKELIDEIDMPTAGVSDEDFIKSIFIKYNNGYGKITTSNAKKAIFNMVSRNNLPLIIQILSITMPTPTLTFEQFKNIIYSNNLDKLFIRGPGMGIYTPLEHREQIPREDISWSKDKIFSCYENIIENKLKKLDWKICQGKLQMLGG